MTKKIAFMVLGLAVTTLGLATEITPQQATEVAKEKLSGEVQNIRSFDYNGVKAYYVVEFREGGWVMVSADDASQPIIGYSRTDRWPSEADMPENFRGMMDCYANEIVQIKQAASRRHRGWEPEARQMAMARANAASDDELKVPLIKVNWAQGSPYKKYCPSDSRGQAVVGCVAVGMAQAMSVAQWPKRPNGYFSYDHKTYGPVYCDYDKEPDYNWSAILNGTNGMDDVARLLWHCGVAIKMDYSPEGSGTQTSLIPGALMRNFDYPASVRFYSRDNYDGDWTELILNELREGRAVAYSGHDSKGNYGHCFNLDAYDGNFFHVNWGWGAGYNRDSWFSVDALNDPNMKMNYDAGHGVVVGIRAKSPYPSNITLSAKEVQAGQPAGTFVADVVVESEAEDPVYSYELRGKYSNKTHSYQEAPFEIVNDQLLTTKELTANKKYEVTITATNTRNLHSIERTFNITATVGAVGVTEVNAVAVGPKCYYSTSGIQLTIPAKGLNIIRQRMSDGTTKTIKVFKK